MLKHASYKIRKLFLEEFAKELIINTEASPKKPDVKEISKPLDLVKPPEKKEEKEIEKLASRLQAAQKEFAPSILQTYGAEGKGRGAGRGGFGIGEGIIGGGEISGSGVAGGGGLKIKKGPGISPIQKQLIKPIDIGSLYSLSARPTGKSKLGLSLGEGEIDLGKLNPLLKDRAITTIECSGPGKFIVVKKAGQVNLTRITLSQQEINEIIEAFSEKTRIPIIGGIFRASVGEFVITAVISEFVGSKFIIYKESPYSLLDAQTQKVQQAQLQHRR